MTYNILHIDDSLTDSDIVQRILHKSGLHVSYRLATNKEELKKELSAFDPDIVLCDHSLPSFNSKKAFVLCKEKRFDLPFILVTGAVSEEFAVDMLKLGIDDYLLKSNLQRLPSAITNAVSKSNSDKKVKSFRFELNRSEAQLRTIFENTSNGFLLLDNDFKIIECNSLLLEFANKTLGILLQKNENILDALPADQRKKLKRNLDSILKKETISCESLHALSDGSTIIFQLNMKPAIDWKGSVVGACISVENITERKKSEQLVRDSEQKYRSLIQNLPEAVYTCDADGFIQLYNKAAIQLWGREPMVGQEQWCGSLKLYDTNGTELALENSPMSTCLREGKALHGKEIIVQRPDNSYRQVLSYPSPLFNDEVELTGASNMLLDITDKKEREILTQKTEEKYHNIFQQASDGIIIFSLDGNIHEFNKACYTMLNYSYEEFEKLVLKNILLDDIKIDTDYLEALRSGETKTLCRTLVRADGSHMETEVSIKMLPEGKVIAFARDITERKKAEQALFASESRLRAIVQAEPECVKLLDKNLCLEDINPAGLAMIEAGTFEQVKGKSVLSIVNEPYRESFRQLTTEVFTGKPGILEYEITGLKGIQRWLETHAVPLRNGNGEIISLLSVTRDFTERKNAEITTKKAIERYDILANATSDTIWDWDITNNKMVYNEGISNMFGYKSSEVKNVVDWWNDKLHPEDRQTVTDALEDVFCKKTERIQLTYRFRCADGSYKYIFDRAFVIFDTAGRPTRMIGAMQDITYRAEEEIRVAKAIIDAQELERQSLGAELHDNINQILAGTVLALGMAKSDRVVRAEQVGLIDTAIGYITDAIEETRKLSHNLAPASFVDSCLKDLFENLLFAINVEDLYLISLDFEEAGSSVIPENTQINLYRILQEQTKNILKYSDASRIEVAVTFVDNAARLRIYDNGKGFDTKSKKTGIGLSNIKKRAEALGGKVILNSAPGKGCEVIVEIPLG